MAAKTKKKESPKFNKLDGNFLLFLNEWEGVSFLLKRKLEKEDIAVEWLNSRKDLDTFIEYEVKSTPVLLVIDNDEVCDRIVTTDEIIDYFKLSCIKS